MVGLVVLCVLSVLGGCAKPVAGPHTYDTVNAVATELKLHDIGDITYEERYGTGSFSDDHPTLYMIIQGSWSGYSVETALRAAGFTKGGSGAWSRGTGKNMVLVYTGLLRPGDAYAKHGSDVPATVEAISTVVEISGQ